MSISRRGFITGLLASSALGPAVANTRPLGFSELTLDLSGAKASATYDVFVYNDCGALKLATGPAWDFDHGRGQHPLVKRGEVWTNDAGGLYIGSLRMGTPMHYYDNFTRSVRTFA